MTQHSHDTRSHQLLIGVIAASDCLVDLKISSISSVIWCQMVYCVPPWIFCMAFLFTCGSSVSLHRRFCYFHFIFIFLILIALLVWQLFNFFRLRVQLKGKKRRWQHWASVHLAVEGITGCSGFAPSLGAAAPIHCITSESFLHFWLPDFEIFRIWLFALAKSRCRNE